VQPELLSAMKKGNEEEIDAIIRAQAVLNREKIAAAEE